MADIVIPQIGESITEVTLTQWLVEDGSYVNEGDLLCEIESDKATLEMPSENSGVIKIMAEEGSELEIGVKIGEIDTEAKPVDKPKEEVKKESEKGETISASENTADVSKDKPYPSPAASKIMREKGLASSEVSGSGKDGRITKGDALSTPASSKEIKKDGKPEEKTENGQSFGLSRNIKKEKMTRLRKTIAKVLVEAKNTTAMLTTFNEVDMHPVMELRKKYKESFKDKHNIGLGFMSFFTKASTMALKMYPGVNGQIEGDNLIYHDYADVGIAVSTPKGLVVPVVRNAESLSFADIEKKIMELALKARDGKITLEEMRGGTFTITNGGIFGSMLSTPIINLPQSGILGMHNIVQRPIAINGQVVIRPIMYIALSYDHRIVDGRESVGFLKTVKELIEDPHRMLIDV
ncbi:MAG: dihydrolipoyllysine-residue succinyltransferase [Halobacteriovoraceae bacterium]|nr:dihydrolipoyllysine-residue succinyltransferase [Halobacteriovoraceae bacterium]